MCANQMTESPIPLAGTMLHYKSYQQKGKCGASFKVLRVSYGPRRPMATRLKFVCHIDATKQRGDDSAVLHS